jgi:hypothetical protein
VITDRWTIETNDIKKIIHDWPVADELGGFYSSLVLVSCIEVENIVVVLFPDGFDHAGHIN